MATREKGAHIPAYILGLLLQELRAAGRISEHGADTIAMLANPDSCWGSRPIHLRSAVQQAVRPRWFDRYGRNEGQATP